MRTPYKTKVFVSQELIDGVNAGRAKGIKSYTYAHAINGEPSWLSKVLNHGLKVDSGDERIIKLGKLLNVPAGRCFEGSEPGQ